MAGAGKAAILATLMFALLASASMVDAARPVVELGSNVAADGRTLVREGRQLRFFLFGCGGLFGWGCYRPYYHPYYFNRGFGFNGGFNNGGDVRIRNDKHRRLNGDKFDYKPRGFRFFRFWWW